MLRGLTRVSLYRHAQQAIVTLTKLGNETTESRQLSDRVEFQFDQNCASRELRRLLISVAAEADVPSSREKVDQNDFLPALNSIDVQLHFGFAIPSEYFALRFCRAATFFGGTKPTPS